MLEEYRDVITASELRYILRAGKQTVYDLLNSGTIANRKYGKRYFIPKQAVIDFLMAK